MSDFLSPLSFRGPLPLKFKRLQNGTDLPLPTYTTSGAAGMDLCAAEDFNIFPGNTVKISTGFAAEVPQGFEIQVRSRSGLAAKHGVFVTNGIGTIDEDYRGEIFVLLSSLGKASYKIQRGDRIAQLVLTPITRPTSIEEVDSLSETGRGIGGLGSTGR